MGANTLSDLSLITRDQGWRQECSDRGVDSSNERAKIWFSEYNTCQISPEKSLYNFRRGASLLRRRGL